MAKARKQFKDEASFIRERRDASARWWNENFWSEFVEVYRASKCMTSPIMKKNKAGKLVEDKTRTNVAMPDISRVIRQNTARMTANPPLLNYLCPDESVATKLTGWRYQQFDRSGEARVRRLHVQQSETFGFSVTKSYWDKISSERTFRRHPGQWDRAMVMEAKGASPEEVEAAIAQAGPALSDQERAAAMAEFGSELNVTTPLTKYEGPRCKFVFIGDYYPEPGFRDIHEGWQVEEYIETDAWLADMLNKTYDDEDGSEQPIFDKKVVANLEKDDSFDYSDLSRYAKGLRVQLRSAIGQSDFSINADRKQLQGGNRYRIFENHEAIDGKMWITWIGNGKYVLGKMPYQWDLGGRSSYTPLVSLPDLLIGVGDSTPRLMRHLYKLHNVTVGGRQDLISNILRRTVFRQRGADIPDEAVERASYRVMDVKSLSDFQVQQEPDVPNGAFEVESAIMRQMASLEPSLFSTDSGDSANPMGGKLATTAVLSQRTQDALLQFKLDNLALYDKELAEKDLLMLQAALQDKVKIHKRYAKTEALTQMFGQNAAVVELDPYEIQEDIDVEPAVGSTLAQDDEFHRMAWERLLQLAQQDPVNWNLNEICKGFSKTIRGADASKLVNPPAPPPQPPPKTTMSITAKFESLPAGVQAKILQGQGLQLDDNDMAELEHQDSMKSMEELGRAADGAAKTVEPADPIAAKARADQASAHLKAGHDVIKQHHKGSVDAELQDKQHKHDIAVAKATPKATNGPKQ